jgi:hypothetical protein
MGYANIENLYEIGTTNYKMYSMSLFKQIWATEKIHGTSAWITYKNDQLSYHAGGWHKEAFPSLFDGEFLLKKMKEIFGVKQPIKLYGEHYGGNIMKMGEIYGGLGFILFDINVQGVFLSFDKVQILAGQLELDIVEGIVIENTHEAIREYTNRPSTLALNRGLGEHIREGIVLRPLEEFRRNNDKRVIAKNKTEKYIEYNVPRKKDKSRNTQSIEKSKQVAFTWVNAMRLEHILSKSFPENTATIRDTGTVIREMIADIKKESVGEAVITKDVEKEIGSLTREYFHDYLESIGEK